MPRYNDQCVYNYSIEVSLEGHDGKGAPNDIVRLEKIALEKCKL